MLPGNVVGKCGYFPERIFLPTSFIVAIQAKGINTNCIPQTYGWQKGSYTEWGFKPVLCKIYVPFEFIHERRTSFMACNI